MNLNTRIPATAAARVGQSHSAPVRLATPYGAT
jgi:hypothetical protein